MPAYSTANPKLATAPTSNSLGAVIHHTHDGQANFWSWFQGSRAVDGLGRPLVLFHGTYPWETEDGRSLGNVFSFDRLASVNIVRRAHSIDTVGVWFSSNPGAGGAEMYGTTIYPVYLDIKTPHETTFSLLLRRARLLANGNDDGRMVGQAEVEALRRWLKAIGKDGIKIVHDPADRSSTEFVRQDAWIALEPEQIKSAIGNDGSFRPGCPLVTGRSKMELEPAPVQLAAPLAATAPNLVVAAGHQVHSPGAAAPATERVAERPTGFNDWFGDSKVVNEQGEPLRVFHGTRSDVKSFSDEFIGDGHGASDWGEGFYFTNSIEAANHYAEGPGGNVMPVYLRMQNPADRSVMMSPRVQDAIDDGMGFESVSEVLAGMGYDGVIIDHADGAKEYVVFEPGQIKSALSNSGAYSLEEADITDGVAPPALSTEPGPKSPEAQAASIDQPAVPSPFTEWFGDSKVTDERGNPRVVYHGTTADVDFNSFWTHPGSSLGAHFGSAEQANDLADPNQAIDDKDEPGARVIPVYLSIRNPLRLVDPGTGGWNNDSIGGQLVALGILDEEIYEGSEYLLPEEYGQAIRSAIEAAGYDGIVYQNRREGIDAEAAAQLGHLRDDEFKRAFANSSDSYIAFHPGQIKSAISNRGGYSPDDPDITDGVTAPRQAPAEAQRKQQTATESVIAAEDVPGMAPKDLLQTQSFASWFDGSMAINSDGSPRMMFHGTRADIRAFSPDHFGRTDAGWAGAAYYFTPDPEEASVYASFVGPQMHPDIGINGANVMPVYLQIRNPLQWRLGTEESIKIQAQRNKLGPKGFVQWLRSRGHDGVHITSRQIGKAKPEDQWIVFEPGQIKSAISNTGRFAPDCHDITDGAGLAPEKLLQSSVKTETGSQAPASPQFRAWFGGSKVIDTRGQPKVLFHGAPKAFTVFKPSKQGTFGPGIYFADTESSARAYLHGDEGESVMQVYVSLRNPWVIQAEVDSPASIDEDWDSPILESVLALPKGRKLIKAAKADESLATYGHFGSALQRHLKELGYDGIIGTYSDGSQEVVAFHPSQIKSATLNSGAYSPDSNDITDGAAARQKPKLR